MNADAIKKDFPILGRSINGKKFVYLDSAATSQKPHSVIEAMGNFYKTCNANVHRGVYKISEEATEAYEKARVHVKEFIGAKSAKEIIYTKSTTEAINLAMRAYGEKFVKKNDKIVVSMAEHHSNFVPWQQLAKKNRATLEVIGMDDEGKLKDDELKSKIKGAKIVALAHASNVLGTVNNAKEICKLAREEGAISVIDGAQSVPHMPVDVKKIGCDFLAFSGHKMLGPTGIGILYGTEEILEQSDPFLFGGEMISSVTTEKTEWNSLPYKFEAGTQPVAEAVGLGAAIDYLGKIGMGNVEKHEKELTKYAMEKLGGIEKLQMYGPKNAAERVGVISFNLAGMHAHDVATVLDEYGIAVRSGHHCAMPLHESLGIAASVRASFYIYNTKEDVDALCAALEEAKKIFKV